MILIRDNVCPEAGNTTKQMTMETEMEILQLLYTSDMFFSDYCFEQQSLSIWRFGNLTRTDRSRKEVVKSSEENVLL